MSFELPEPFISPLDPATLMRQSNPAHVPPVYRDRPCPDGKVLNKDGVCVTPGAPNDVPGEAPSKEDQMRERCRTMGLEYDPDTGGCREPDQPGGGGDQQDPDCPPGTMMTVDGRCIPKEDIPTDPECPPGMTKDDSGRCIQIPDENIPDDAIPTDEVPPPVEECYPEKKACYVPADEALRMDDGSTVDVVFEGWSKVERHGRVATVAVVRDPTGRRLCAPLCKDHGACCDACALGAPCSGCSGDCDCGCGSKTEVRFAVEKRYPNPAPIPVKMEYVGPRSGSIWVRHNAPILKSPFIRRVMNGYVKKQKAVLIVPRAGFAFVRYGIAKQKKTKIYGVGQDLKTGDKIAIVRRYRPGVDKLKANPADIYRELSGAKRRSRASRGTMAVTRHRVTNPWMKPAYRKSMRGLYENPDQRGGVPWYGVCKPFGACY